jgi:DNA invertase Pin-like site-specific DNA recombinase
MSGRAVAYIRTDSAGSSLEDARAQRLDIERWAARERVAITSWQMDAGVPGTTPIAERPGLVAAYRALAPEGARALVAANASCFSRDELVSWLIERAALAFGAALHVADGSSLRDRATPLANARAAAPRENVGFTRAAIDLARAHERVVLRERIRATFAAKRARGERIGTVPYGFRLAADGVHLELHEAEQDVIHIVRQLSSEGFSQRAIVAQLEARGVRGRTGASLRQTQVAKILRS